MSVDATLAGRHPATVVARDVWQAQVPAAAATRLESGVRVGRPDCGR